MTSTTDDMVRVQTLSGSSVAFRAADVHFIAKRSPTEEEYETRLAGLPESAEEHWDLASWCKLNRLRDQHTRQLWEVLLRDPNHAEARRALGYSFDKGFWRTREQLMRRRGYVKVGARFITRQERDSNAKTDGDRKAEAAWKRRLSGLADRVNSGDTFALADLRAIRDPLAVSALVAYFRDSLSAEVRMAYVGVLGQIGSPNVLAPMIEQAVFDVSPDVRTAALRFLPMEHERKARVMLAKYLEDDRNATVQYAAAALGQVGDKRSIEPLIEALVTPHEYATRPSAAQEVRDRAVDLLNREDLTPDEVLLVMQTGITPKRGVVSTTDESQGRIQLLYPHRNPAVLEALKSLTGEDFGFDERTWRLWHRSQ